MMSGRQAVVTGGGKGIGRAVTLALAGSGHRVIALGRDASALEAVREEAPEGRVAFRVCDVTDEAAVAAALDEAGDVDVLVNNAGIAESAPLADVSLESWERHLRTNATSAFLCSRAVLPGMRDRGWGRIVSIGSTASVAGAPYIAAYAASKHAVLALMRVIAAEVKGTGVTANTVCPGFVRSEMTERSAQNITERTGRSREDAEATLARMNAVGRLIEPEEVAVAVSFLVSDNAGAVNGQAIVLEGGAVQP